MRHRHPLCSGPSARFLASLWVCVGLSACTATGEAPFPTSSSTAPFETAQNPVEAPEPGVAPPPEMKSVPLARVEENTPSGVLERFLLEWPRDPLADDAALELARRAAENGQYARAERQLVWATRTHGRGDRIDEIRLLLAEVQRAAGERDTAYRTAARIRLAKLAPADRHRVHVLLSQLSAERGDPVLSLRWWARAHASAPNQTERERIEDVIDETLLSLDRSDLEKAARKLEGRFPSLRVQLRLAEMALENDDLDRARKALEAAATLPGTSAENERRLALQSRLAGSTLEAGPSAAELPSFSEVRPVGDLRGASGTIGVVLPLSGQFSGFGEECLRGVLMAAEVFGGGDGGVHVLVRDSGGTPDGAARAVEELASVSSVSAIIGPLLASEAEAAAGVAEARRVPLLALTGRDEVAQERPWVFRAGREPRGEIEVLVDHAIRDAGLGRFAILYPDDAYGRGARDLFWDQVEARGGRVVGVESYEPGVPDFAGPIRSLVGFAHLTPAVKEALETREDMLNQAKRLPAAEALALRAEAKALRGPNDEPLPPIVGFDALFIPDSYEQVTLIAPQLAFHEVKGVRLLGSSGWNHPDLVRIGGYHMNRAIFTETFYPDSDVPYVAEFSKGFEAAYGAPPGSLAALSFDAGRLTMAQLAQGLNARDRMRDALLRVRAYPGVSGVTNIRADGTAQKRPYLLGVKGRRIVALEK